MITPNRPGSKQVVDNYTLAKWMITATVAFLALAMLWVGQDAFGKWLTHGLEAAPAATTATSSHQPPPAPAAPAVAAPAAASTPSGVVCGPGGVCTEVPQVVCGPAGVCTRVPARPAAVGAAAASTASSAEAEVVCGPGGACTRVQTQPEAGSGR
ncbi:hypothetical protein [Kineococcus sp. SYSU DK005]|uniref:hypothetical protein n=1 Tax=Kineococcus sp. SYSU DK005 TaxID=3383126 RepID=UPI003D7E90E3